MLKPFTFRVGPSGGVIVRRNGVIGRALLAIPFAVSPFCIRSERIGMDMDTVVSVRRRHLLPTYWTFPPIFWRNDVLCRMAIFAGERFNGGRYCFRPE